jgi:predicted metal-dependent peptidase
MEIKIKKCDCDNGNYSFNDPFGFGSLLDDHIEVEISEEDLAKRCAGAFDLATKAGGLIPAGLEGELGNLLKPKIRTSDILQQIISKKREGVGNSDFSSPKIRPLAAGLFLPRRKCIDLKILVAYDCSGSMLEGDQIALGISQLQVLDKRGEMVLIPFDTEMYIEDMVKIKRANIHNLRKSKVRGLGGTAVGDVFNTYEKHCGKVDLIIIVSDMYFSDFELKDVKIPTRDVKTIWLCTSKNKSFKPKFGRVVYINN